MSCVRCEQCRIEQKPERVSLERALLFELSRVEVLVEKRVEVVHEQQVERAGDPSRGSGRGQGRGRCERCAESRKVGAQEAEVALGRLEEDAKRTRDARHELLHAQTHQPRRVRVIKPEHLPTRHDQRCLVESVRTRQEENAKQQTRYDTQSNSREACRASEGAGCAAREAGARSWRTWGPRSRRPRTARPERRRALPNWGNRSLGSEAARRGTAAPPLSGCARSGAAEYAAERSPPRRGTARHLPNENEATNIY